MQNIPSPVLDEIRREFLADTDDILGRLEELLPAIREREGTLVHSALDETYRRVHSLKGSAGMFGFPGVSTLCHQLEEFLEPLRTASGPVPAPDLGLLGRSIALLRGIFTPDDRRERDAPTTTEMEALGADLRRRRAEATVAAAGPRPALDADLSADLALLSDEERERIAAAGARGDSLFRFGLEAPRARFEREREIFQSRLVTPLELVALLPGVPRREGTVAQGFLVAGPRASLDALRAQDASAFESVEEIPVRAIVAEPEAAPAAPVTSARPDREATRAESAAAGRASGTTAVEPVPLPEDATPLPGTVRAATVRVRLDELELLTEIAGELHLAAGKMVRRRSDTAREPMAPSAEREAIGEAQLLARRAGDLRRRLLELRMVPIRPVLTRFFPIVQSLAWESGREIELKVVGEETRVDRTVLEALGEPLLHLVRNAVDHGLEPPEDRVKAGKDRRGHLVLEARAEDQHVTVEVRDDGRGIDRAGVERKARERGLLGDRGSHGDVDLWRCLFTPGFTTRERATELSGRGIGLDVVRRAVLTLQGLVEIVSTAGVGTRVVLRLPQSLTVTRGLVARLGDLLFAFPLHSVVGVRAAGRERRGTEIRFRPVRREEVPVLDLARYFTIAGDRDRAARRSVVLAGVAEKRMGIIVDKIISQQELLVRPLGMLLAGHAGISGVAELAGGELAIVMDIPGLVAALDPRAAGGKGAS